MSDLYIGAYWSARREGAFECADRLRGCIKHLAAVDDVFVSWFKKGAARRGVATRLDDANGNEVLQLVERGKNRRDSDQTTIDTLGFTASVWNGRQGEHSASLALTCGCWSPSPHVCNSFVVDFPRLDAGDVTKSIAVAALTGVARVCQPDWAGVISRSSRQQRNFDPRRPFVDWMIFLPRTDISSYKLPQELSINVVDGVGTIIVTRNEPRDLGSSDHIEVVRAIESALQL